MEALEIPQLALEGKHMFQTGSLTPPDLHCSYLHILLSLLTCEGVCIPWEFRWIPWLGRVIQEFLVGQSLISNCPRGL